MSAGAPWIVRMEYVEPKKRRRKATPKFSLPKFEVVLGERLRDPLAVLLEEAARPPYQLPLRLRPKPAEHELTQREAASMGGRARAKSMTKQARSASARAAALKRWEKRRRENSGVVAHDAAAPSEDEARRR